VSINTLHKGDDDDDNNNVVVLVLVLVLVVVVVVVLVDEVYGGYRYVPCLFLYNFFVPLRLCILY